MDRGAWRTTVHGAPEDTASEAGTPQGEAQARDDGDEEGLLTHSEEELVRACLGGWLVTVFKHE